MKKSFLRPGVQWLFVLLLLASRSAGPAIRPIAERCELPRDAGTNCATPRSTTKTRSSTSWPRAVIRTSGPSSRRFCEDRLYFRNDDQKVFLVKSAATEDSTTLDLIDPVTLKSAGSASVDDLTKIGTNNHLRRVLQTTLARFGLSSPDASVRLDAVRRHRARLGRRQRAAVARAKRGGNQFQSQKRNCHGPGARCAGWFGCAGASRRDLHAPPQPPPGCAEQTAGFDREISRRHLRRKR